MTRQRRPALLQLQAFTPALEAALEARYAVHRLFADDPSDSGLARIAPSIRAVVTGAGKGMPAWLWSRLPALEIIAVHGVGLDAIDLDLAARRKVAVTTTPGVLAEDVAELAVALWLALKRQLPAADRYVREGLWPAGPPLPLTRRASGARVGILGMGAIGQAVARLAAPFASSVAYHARRPVSSPHQYVASAAELARQVDALFVAVSGGADTTKLVDRTILAALGSDGVLINVSRGSVVDERALIEALNQGTIAGAALDVFDDEPRVPTGLRGSERVVLSPHRGSATQEARLGMAERVLEALEKHFSPPEPRP